jgi:hypothetical protein
MTDDQLRSELERRAGSAPTQPDWAKRTLLPAVWHEVDARPVPVITSRWPSLAGAAALVAALLILVVAVPSLTPKPPAASPPGLEVLSTQSFASAVQAGQLSGQTVLVDAAIVAYDGPVIFGGLCTTCLMGQLEGISPRLLVFGPDLAVADAVESSLERSSGWPWWRRLTPPIRGTLVFSVDDQSVEYLGRVVPGGDSLSWSAGQVKTQLDVNARDLDEVVLVNGYLTGLDAAGSCPAPATSPIPGLPLHYGCVMASWLADKPVVIDTDLQVVPPSAIQVQADAFATYAPDPSARLGLSLAPQRALYAVSRRLYGNGCIDPSQPCWDWSVVGRLSQPAPDVTPPSMAPVVTPEIAPSPSPSGLTPVARTISCQASEALGDPGVALIDHSGLISGCSLQQASRPVGSSLEVAATADPNRLAVSWIVPAGCPFDGEHLEFWGPIDDLPGPADYLLQLKRFVVDPTCDVMQARRVDISFTETIQPADIWALAVDETTSDNTLSSFDSDGGFLIQLEASARGLAPNSPLDIKSSLTYHGADPVTLSGWWQPNFAFAPLAGGPSFDSYGHLLLCPDLEADLSQYESIVGHLDGPTDLDPTDPNYEYRKEYAYDGKFRLPEGSYLIYTGVNFSVGQHCTGDNVQLRTAIVIRVGPESVVEPTEPPTTAVDCSPTFLLLEETGLVEACSTWTPEPGQSGVSQGPDASSVFVAWTYSYCRGAPFVRFKNDGDRYVFDLGHLVTLPMPPPSCEPVTRTLGIAVRFTEPLDVGLIDAVSRP